MAQLFGIGAVCLYREIETNLGKKFYHNKPFCNHNKCQLLQLETSTSCLFLMALDKENFA